MKTKFAGLAALSFLLALAFVVLTFQMVSAATRDQLGQSISGSAHSFYTTPRRISSLQQPPPVLTATVQAVSGTTIVFHDNNDSQIPAKTLPYLVLYQDGGLTPAVSRTVVLSVTGIEVPPPGVTVTLDVVTQHGDPDQGGAANKTISVWFESQWITNTSPVPLIGATVVFTHEFTDTVVSGTMLITTPTDYFQYGVVIGDLNAPLHSFGGSYAFLMENQATADVGNGYEVHVRGSGRLSCRSVSRGQGLDFQQSDLRDVISR